MFEGILGLRPGNGAVKVEGNPKTLTNARDAMNAGVVYLSEDRKGKGLLLTQDLRMNLTLASTEKFSQGIVMDSTKEWAALDHAFDEFDIRARSKNMLAGQLSGGNQQKLLLAKMMLLQPKIVVIDEPTRGLFASKIDW